MIRVRLLPALALAAGLLAGANAGAQPVVRPVAQPAPAQAPALPVVPASSGAFVTLKVRDLANHPDLKPVLAQLAKQPDALAGVSEVIGVSPLELDRVTLFWPRFGRGASEPILVVTTVEPFNEARVLKALKAQPVFDGGFGGRDVWEAPRATKQAVPNFKSAEPIAPGKSLLLPDSGAEGGSSLPKLKEKAPGKEPKIDLGKIDEDEVFCSAQLDEGADPLFYALDRGPFSVLLLIDERTLVFMPGRRDADLTAMTLLAASLKKGNTGPLADALATAGKHTLAAGVYLPPLLRHFDRRIEPELVPYTALLATRTATLTGDLDKSAKFALTLKYEDATAAKRAAPVLEEGIATVATKVEEVAGEWRDSARPFEKAAAPVMSAFAAGLKKAAVRADGTTVLATAEVDAGAATAKALGELLQAVQSRRKAELRMNNLKMIGLALHSYHDANGRMPNNVYGPKGELLLSWRVQILPYLEEDALYRQFKMDEPWDGPNNKLLIEKVPKVFQAPDRDHAKGKTFYQGFVERERLIPVKGLFGRPWLKDGDKTGPRFADFTDGLSNTLAVIEAGEGVVWSKPDDLPFGGAVPALGEKGWDRTPVLLFDGSVRMFPTKLKPEAFWPHVTINGGEVTVDPDDDRRGPFGGGRRPVTEPAAEAPVPAKAKELDPLPAKDAPPGARAELLAAKLAVTRAQVDAAAAQSEAAALILARLEKLAASGAVAEAEVARAKAVHAESLARVGVLRREVAVLEAELKAAKEKDAPRK